MCCSIVMIVLCLASQILSHWWGELYLLRGVGHVRGEESYECDLEGFDEEISLLLGCKMWCWFKGTMWLGFSLGSMVVYLWRSHTS